MLTLTCLGMFAGLMVVSVVLLVKGLNPNARSSQNEED